MAPVLVAGGTLPAATYYFAVTYVNAHGESLQSSFAYKSQPANNTIAINSPPAFGDAVAYNVYVNTIGNSPYPRQNVTPIPIGTAWNEATTGLTTSGPNLPSFDTANFAQYQLPSSSDRTSGITRGPDGNIWFTVGSTMKIGRITPAGAISEFQLPTAGFPAPDPIVSGSDGNLWFAEVCGKQIGKITVNGVATILPTYLAGNPVGITSGPDGNLWISTTGPSNVYKLTTAGVFTAYPAPDGGAITTGPDGNLWVTGQNSKLIFRMTTSGQYSTFSQGITPGVMPVDIVTGPDNNLWFTECNGNIAKLTP